MRALLSLASLLLLGALTLEARSEPTSPEPGSHDSRVARAVFATEIVDREPVDRIARLPSADHQVFYFTELLGLEGRTVRHRWEFQGETMAEIAFDVGGARWRVYSSKKLLEGWEGEWTASVVLDDGTVLTESTLAYGTPERPAGDARVEASPQPAGPIAPGPSRPPSASVP